MTKAIHIPDHLLFDGNLPSADVLRQLETMQPAEAGLSDWQKARLGKITASRFGLVKKLKTGNWGETALSYLYDLMGEHLTGQPSQTFTGNDATEWGSLYEQEALEAYTKRTGRKVKATNIFLQHPDLQFVGGTPDGLVGEKGVIEVKCPMNFKNHIRTIINRTVPDEYRAQVYGHLWLSGRQWCDFVSYDPRIPKKYKHARLAIIRVYRSSERIAELESVVSEFHNLLLAELAALKIQL